MSILLNQYLKDESKAKDIIPIIEETLQEAQGDKSLRVLTSEDILRISKSIILYLGYMPKDAVQGTIVIIDPHAADTYVDTRKPQSTHFSLKRTVKGWAITSIVRSKIREQKVTIRLTNEGKSAMINHYTHPRLEDIC